MAISTETATPSTNGELIDRVQQLRLTDQLGAGSARGSNRGAWLPWVLCGLMAVTWAGVGVRWYKNAPAPGAGGMGGPPGAGAPGAARPPASGGQGGSAPAAAPGELILQLKGTLTPFLQINLSPDDVSGTVTQIFFKEGDQVKKNAELAKIRDDRYRHDRDAAKAALEAAEFRLKEMLPESVRKIEVEQAQAEWEEAEAGRIRAQQELDRVTGQRATGVISKQDLEKADADLRAAVARVTRLAKAKALLIAGPREEKVAAARADVESAKARHLEAERLLKNCTVLAPIDGTILTKVADQGVLVSPMSFNVAAGICSMADLSDLESEIEVREDEIMKVKPGMRCEVAPSGNPSRVYEGRVDRIMPIADDTKGIVKVRVKVKLPARGVAKEEPGEFLKPKMSTIVRVYGDIIPEFGAKKP